MYHMTILTRSAVNLKLVFTVIYPVSSILYMDSYNVGANTKLAQIQIQPHHLHLILPRNYQKLCYMIARLANCYKTTLTFRMTMFCLDSKNTVATLTTG